MKYDSADKVYEVESRRERTLRIPIELGAERWSLARTFARGIAPAVILFGWGNVVLLSHTQERAETTGVTTFDVGSTGHRISLVIGTPPAPGDSINIQSTSKQVQVGIFTPAGQEITPDNAKALGFDWFVDKSKVPLGEDGGENVQVVFAKPGAPGTYILQFRPPPPATVAHIEVKFISRLKEYTELLQSVNNGRILPS